MSEVEQKIDFLITTMDRYTLLVELVNSIHEYYPNAEITVADQSENFKEHIFAGGKVKIHKLPEDCGLSYARNFLVKNTDKPYKLILEDDFLFDENTKIEKMLSLANKGTVVGGSVIQNGVRIPFEFNFKKEDGVLYQVDDGNNWQYHENLKFKETQCVMNFCLFAQDIFCDILWDEALKLREHQDFFYRLSQTNHNVIFTPEVSITDNRNIPTEEYKRKKARDEFWVIMMEKHKISKVVYLDGHTVELENGKIHRYRDLKINAIYREKKGK